jgi:tetratricopeptide (TPR) repeat protein
MDAVRLQDELIKDYPFLIGQICRVNVDLVISYSVLGRYDDARNLLETAAGRRLIAIFPSDAKIYAMHHLAYAYLVVSEYDEAIELYKSVVALTWEGRLDAGHPVTLASMHYLAETYLKQRNYVKGVELIDVAREKLQKCLGPRPIGLDPTQCSLDCIIVEDKNDRIRMTGRGKISRLQTKLLKPSSMNCFLFRLR